MADDAISAEGLTVLCQNYAKYLTGQPASPYVVERFVRYAPGIPRYAGDDDAIERRLLNAARRGGAALALADTYAAALRPRAIVRRQLVLMIAVLENARESHRQFDEPLAGGRVATLLRLAGAGVAWGARLVLALAVFGPAHAVSRRSA